MTTDTKTAEKTAAEKDQAKDTTDPVTGKPAATADTRTPEQRALDEARDDAERAKRRVELLEARAKATDPDERKRIARELAGLEADELADLAADLMAHGTSIVGVIKKAAHNAFGITL